MTTHKRNVSKNKTIEPTWKQGKESYFDTHIEENVGHINHPSSAMIETQKNMNAENISLKAV